MQTTTANLCPTQGFRRTGQQSVEGTAPRPWWRNLRSVSRAQKQGLGRECTPQKSGLEKGVKTHHSPPEERITEKRVSGLTTHQREKGVKTHHSPWPRGRKLGKEPIAASDSSTEEATGGLRKGNQCSGEGVRARHAAALGPEVGSRTSNSWKLGAHGDVVNGAQMQGLETKVLTRRIRADVREGQDLPRRGYGGGS